MKPEENIDYTNIFRENDETIIQRGGKSKLRMKKNKNVMGSWHVSLTMTYLFFKNKSSIGLLRPCCHLLKSSRKWCRVTESSKTYDRISFVSSFIQ